jgi:hypothetical protein
MLFEGYGLTRKQEGFITAGFYHIFRHSTWIVLTNAKNLASKSHRVKDLKLRLSIHIKSTWGNFPLTLDSKTCGIKAQSNQIEIIVWHVSLR